jgi:cephalosporin-C deacetylase-like acetyl esterase
MAMRQDIEFDAEGVTLRGWLYLPDEASGPVPTVVMAHGFSAVKEMFLDSFAEAFAAGGLGALVFDNRNFGASDGEPRQEIDPWAQVRDYRHAITWAQARSEVDADRIGVWGSSYSGGHVLVLGAIDKRIKCVVCQVPLVSGVRNIQRLVRQDSWPPTGPPWIRTAPPATGVSLRPWCRSSTPTHWPSRRDRRPTLGSGSARPERAGHRRGATR